MKIISLRYGYAKAHAVNESWFKAVGAEPTRSFIGTSSLRVLNLGPLVTQPLALIRGLFLPKADVYLLATTGAALSVMLKSRKSKVIAVNSDTFFRDMASAGLFKRLFYRFLLRRVDALISTSEMNKKLAEKFTNKPNKIVSPFLDIKRFIKVKPNLESTNICSIGIGTTTKGNDILIEAFKIIKKKYPGTKLYLIGEGEYAKKMSGIKDVVLTGRADPAEYFPKCGLYINASRHESFGVNIVESLAAGIPPIVTENCGAKDIVAKVDPNLIAKVDASDIARKAIVLHQSRKKYLLSEKGRKLVLGHTQEKSNKAFAKVFKELIAELDRKNEKR